MQVNPYESPPPAPENSSARTLQDGRWSLVLTGLFAGGYVGAWVGSLSGAGVGVLLALSSGGSKLGYGDPAMSFIEGLISTGLLIAIVGTLIGAVLGAALGMLLGSLVSVSPPGLRKIFVCVSCVAACVAAVGLTAFMFRTDMAHQESSLGSANPTESIARLAAMCVVGLGSLFGGGLLGRILREVAWEPGPQTDVVRDTARPTIN